jgi:catalase
MSDYTKLTNEVGAPVADNENSITAGPRGPVVMQDVWLMEKMAHFNREVIPERRMHAKGWGAYGKFTVTHDISRYTKAKVLQPGTVTDLFLRFSTVAGERGAADCERDIRGVAVKFYTSEGNWDLVGNNTPTFFIRDVHNFSDLNRAVKRDPRTGRRSAQNNWDFWTLLPECFHQITVVMSDRGIPASFRNMHFFGEHTYSFYNEKNERVWCKFHFKTQQGIRNLSNEEAAKINGMDREYHGRDLYDAIERGDFPKWTMYVQIMTEEQAKTTTKTPSTSPRSGAMRISPHRGGRAGAQPQPGELFCRSGAGRLYPATWCPASAFRRTGSCRAASLPTAMPSATAWA